MCLAVPAKVTAIEGSLATVEIRGVQRQASLMLLPEAAVVIILVQEELGVL